jgi:signal peptidase
MKNFLKIIWKVLKWIMSIFIILIVSVIVIQRVSNNKFTLGGYSIFTVVTQSMIPKYQVGDMLLAKSSDTSKLKVGDDVVYMGAVGTFQGKIVTHQIVDIEEGSPRKFHTKGINNMIEDPVINETQILGKVVMKLTILSMISKVISNQFGFFFIIFVPIVVLVFGIVMDTVNDKKKKSE